MDQQRKKRDHHREGQTHHHPRPCKYQQVLPQPGRLLERELPPHHLRDYVHGADLNSDSLGLLPLTVYDQSDLSDLLNNSSQHIQERIQIQEEEMRARDAREQARIQKRLARGPRDLSPRED
jgi:hypothetical protein